MKRMYGYGRASTDTQQITLLAQREVCEAYFNLRHKGGEEIEWAGWFPDASVTSKIPWFSRPMGEKIFLQVKPGDVVVISNFDRVFRSVINCDECLTVCNEKEIALAILDVEVNTATPLGRAFMKIIAVLKELEREEISRRTREAMQYKIRHGLPVCQFCPIGWKIVGRKSKARYKADVETRRWCYEVVRLYDSTGIECKSISQHLIRIKAGNSESWHHRKVRKMYVAAKCGFPLVPEGDIPGLKEFFTYLRGHDGQPPRLVHGAMSKGLLHTLPPMDGPVQVAP